MELKEKIGKRIIELREEKGISQEYLANDANITRKTMHNIERGKVNVSVYLLAKVCIALKISVSDFFDGIDIDEDDLN